MENEDETNASAANSDDGCESSSVRGYQSYLQDLSHLKSVPDSKLERAEQELFSSSSNFLTNDSAAYRSNFLVGISNIPRFNEGRAPAGWNLNILEKVCKTPRTERRSCDEAETPIADSACRQFEPSRLRSRSV